MRASKSFCASAFFSAAFWLAALGCGHATDSGSTSAPLGRESPSASTVSDAGACTVSDAGACTVSDAGACTVSDAGACTVSDGYAVARPADAKSIGHTSYVLKLRLEGGILAAFKPSSRLPLGDRRYRGEIAAYRLSRALGLDNVPRAIARSFTVSELREAFATAQGKEQFDRTARADGDAHVRGALLPWIPDYEVLPLEEPAWRAKWTAWLTTGDVPADEGDRSMARAISTMLAFDYLTANWDRWSGGNVARHAATGAILFVDNDGAFYEEPPTADLARQLARLRAVTRFSRTFVGALRGLNAAKIASVLGDESPGRPLLPDSVMAAIEVRRETILSLIDARVARAGESATLAFE